MGQNTQKQRIEVISEKTVNRVLGTIIFLTAIIVVGTNLYFRYTDRNKGKGYDYTEGVVTGFARREVWIGRNRRTEDTILVEYRPKYSEKPVTFSGNDFSYQFIRRGEVLRVYYKGTDPGDAFIAKYDWLVKDYLPAYKSYNIPLIVAAILMTLGIYFFVDETKKKSGGVVSNGPVYAGEPGSGITIDPVAGRMYDENLHQLARMSNYKRSWMGFWVFGSIFGTAFIVMGLILGFMAWTKPGFDSASRIPATAAGTFFMILGSGFIPLILFSLRRQTRRKTAFLKAFMADEATSVYSNRSKAAKVLWKHVNHYMEKETPWSRYKLEYSRFWLCKYKDKLEKYR